MSYLNNFQITNHLNTFFKSKNDPQKSVQRKPLSDITNSNSVSFNNNNNQIKNIPQMQFAPQPQQYCGYAFTQEDDEISFDDEPCYITNNYASEQDDSDWKKIIQK